MISELLRPPAGWALLVAGALSMMLGACATVSSTAPHTLSQPNLVVIYQPNPDTRTAVVLVGGINDTFHFLDRWGERYRSLGFDVYGFACDFRSMTMTEAAGHMERELMALSDSGVERLIITAHSMGGLVAKHALDRMAASGLIDRFRTVQLNALGTPWGGFQLANLVRHAPFPLTIGRLIGYPMGAEIGSGSAFMKGLATPFPPNASLNIIHGATDAVATPRRSEEIERYDAVVKIAGSHEILPDVDHTGFRDPDAIFPKGLAGPVRFPQQATWR